MVPAGNKARRGVNARKMQRNAKKKRHPLREWYDSFDWQRARFCLAGGLFVAIWGVLWVRAAQVQLFDGASLAERARRQHTRVELVTGQRGMILDRNGQVLARNVECRSVYVNPREVVDRQHTAATLSGILGLPVERVAAVLERDKAFVWLARKVDDATTEAVRAAGLPGVGLVREYERIYPFKQVAGQLLGFTDVDSNGREGLERAFDGRLSGMSARRVVRRDGAGRRFYQEGDPVPSGEDVRLTIDVQVQFLAEEALAEAVKAYEAKWAGALIVDVADGDILAWAQYPFFNPNNYRAASPATYRNRIALDALEPGSTLKPLLVAAAMQEGVITRDTVFNCENGVWKNGRAVIRDDNRVHGEMPVHRILGVSSNIGSAKISLKLGAPRYHDYLTRLGFGQRTGLHVAESKGILHRVRDWTETDLMSIGFGQGMASTVLQMTQAYMTLGNGGVSKPLRLIRDADAQASPAGERIFSEKVAAEVLDMMRGVVEEGTGKRAAIPGIDVAGKTGTAQKADKTGTYGNQRTASFVGFVPAESPRYLVVIMIDEPQRNSYGGVIAAPVFKNVMLRTLAYHGVPPDPALAEAQQAAQKGAGKSGSQATAAGKASPNVRTAARTAARTADQTGADPTQAAEPAAEPAQATGLALLAPELEETPPGEYRYDITENVRKAAGTKVPNVVGKSVRGAVELFVLQGVVPEVRGEGSVVVRQTPAPGSAWPDDGSLEGRECILWISEK